MNHPSPARSYRPHDAGLCAWVAVCVALIGGLHGCGEPSGIGPLTVQVMAPHHQDTILSGDTIVLRATVEGAVPRDGVTLEWATPWGRVIGRGDSTFGTLTDTGTYAVAVLARRGAEVLATDRVLVTVVPNGPPLLTLEPIPQPCFAYVTDTVRLIASATDPETSPTRIQWFSDRRGHIGEGDTLHWVPGAGAEGPHVISARATDPQGNRDEELVMLRVLGGPLLKWARAYPSLLPGGACGGAVGDSWVLALADDGTLVAGLFTYVTSTSPNTLWSLTPGGDMRWMRETYLQATEHWAGLVLAPDGRAFFAANDGVLQSLSPDGVVQWSANVFNRDWHGRLALAPDGALYASGAAPDRPGYHDLVRLDPETGDEVWRVSRAVASRSSLGIRPDGNLTQTAGQWALDVSPSGAIQRVDSTLDWFAYRHYAQSAIDARGYGYHPVQGLTALRPDHTTAWHAFVPAQEPVIGADGAIYAASGTVLTKLLADGRTAWTAALPVVPPIAGVQSIIRMALLADGTLWVGSGRFLIRFWTGTGEIVEQVELADQVSSGLAVAGDGTLYAVTGRNRIVAIVAGAPLDLAAPWPIWRRDNRRTSSVPRP